MLLGILAELQIQIFFDSHFECFDPLFSKNFYDKISKNWTTDSQI